MQVIEMPKVKCLKCGHEWKPRAPKVYTCPKCHSYKWDEPIITCEKPPEP